MYHWNIKFQEKIFTCKKVIQLWNFGNFGISEIIPKTLVTLRFLKVSLHELESNWKCFQMRYWPIFYIHPTHNSTHFSTWPGRKITNAHDCTCYNKHQDFNGRSLDPKTFTLIRYVPGLAKIYSSISVSPPCAPGTF